VLKRHRKGVADDGLSHAAGRRRTNRALERIGHGSMGLMWKNRTRLCRFIWFYNFFFTRYGLKIIWFCIVLAIVFYVVIWFYTEHVHEHTDWLMKKCCVCGEIHGLLVATLAP
jgi:hypothetical protein